MDRRFIDIAGTTALIILSIVILTNDSLVEGGVETELSSMLLPRIVACLIIFFSAMIGLPSLLSLVKRAPMGQIENISTKGFFGVGVYIVILVLYWYGMPRLGFLLATPIAMFLISVLLGGRNWMLMAAMSVGVTFVVYFGSNHFLRVILPSWSLG